MGGGGGLGQLITVAAVIYTGGAAAGLWGAEAAAGAGLAEGFGGAGILGESAAWGLGESLGGAGALAGAGASEGFGGAGILGDSAAWGLEEAIGAAPFGTVSSEAFSGGLDPFEVDGAMQSSMVGDSVNSFTPALTDPSSASNLNSFYENSPISVESQLGNSGSNSLGADTSLQGSTGIPEVTSSDLSTLGDVPAQPPQPTSTLEGMNSTLEDRFSGPNPFADTTGVNKDYSRLTGYGMDNSYGKGVTGLPTGTEGELKNMWNTANKPLWDTGSKLFRAPTPLGMAGRGLSALFDVKSNNDAMKMLQQEREALQQDRTAQQQQLALSNTFANNNAARGSTANSLWQQNFQNPNAGYNDFMRGAGADFVNQARAAAAKNGSRGGYLNSGKMQSDLASLWMKNQNSRGNALSQGFVTSNPYQVVNQRNDTITPALAGMKRNQYAPIGQAIAGIDRGFSLADMFGDR